MAGKKKVEKSLVVGDDFQKQLAEFGLADMLLLAEDIDTALVVHPTGFIGVDETFNPITPGLAQGIDVELYSDAGSAGKTTLALQILQKWQSIGLKTAFVDIETAPGLEAYMNELGIITRQELCPPGIYAVRILRGKINRATGEVHPLSLEDVFNTVEKAAKYVFDLVVVDSIDALVEKSEMEKTADENNKMMGISKKMSEFMRKIVLKKATVIWLNQTRETNGYSPTGASPKKTSGGRATLFYAELRVKVTQVKKLVEKKGDEEVAYGFTTQVMTIKNKTCSRGMWRSCTLNYIFGEGFSTIYDYFNIAKTKGIIEKKGGWYNAEALDLKVQGEKNMYLAIKENRNGSWDKLRSLLDGTDVEVVTEETENASTEEG